MYLFFLLRYQFYSFPATLTSLKIKYFKAPCHSMSCYSLHVLCGQRREEGGRCRREEGGSCRREEGVRCRPQTDTFLTRREEDRRLGGPAGTPRYTQVWGQARPLPPSTGQSALVYFPSRSVATWPGWRHIWAGRGDPALPGWGLALARPPGTGPHPYRGVG